MGSWALGHLVRLSGSWAFGHLGFWTLGLMGSRAHGLSGSWALGLMGTWVHGLLGSWAYGLLGTSDPLARGAKVAVVRESHKLFFESEGKI
jgi:hypothetical protein